MRRTAGQGRKKWTPPCAAPSGLNLEKLRSLSTSSTVAYSVGSWKMCRRSDSCASDSIVWSTFSCVGATTNHRKDDRGHESSLLSITCTPTECVSHVEHYIEVNLEKAGAHHCHIAVQ